MRSNHAACTNRPQQSTLSQQQSTHLDAFDLLLRPQQLVLQVLLLLLDVLLLPVKKAALLFRHLIKAVGAATCAAGQRMPPTSLQLCPRLPSPAAHLDLQELQLPLQRLQLGVQVLGAAAAAAKWRRSKEWAAEATAARRRPAGGGGRGLRGCRHPKAMDRGCWGLGAAGPPFSLPGDHSRLVSATSIASAFCGRAGTSRAACTAAAALILRAGCPPRPLPRSSRCLRRCPGR